MLHWLSHYVYVFLLYFVLGRNQKVLLAIFSMQHAYGSHGHAHKHVSSMWYVSHRRTISVDDRIRNTYSNVRCIHSCVGALTCGCCASIATFLCMPHTDAATPTIVCLTFTVLTSNCCYFFVVTLFLVLFICKKSHRVEEKLKFWREFGFQWVKCLWRNF